MSKYWSGRRIAAYIAAAVILILSAGVAIEWRDITRLVFVRSMLRPANASLEGVERDDTSGDRPHQ